MKKLPQITDAEWEVMKILWAREECLSSEIVKQLTETMDWSPKTIRTLLNRLVQKEAVGINKDESRRAQMFYPLVSENEYLQSETKTFLQKLYGGAIKPMLANFLQEKKLTEQEINELKQLFDDNKNDDNKSKTGI
ncbi:BlaI/MecI/CopY family transcriptional regulator [Paenibacillus radicis (ex Xue et al. 2023)]|uniref:BlaI/MecI/CopY family transcriptional regulator n=1 Tax=Paenibacillus radicis (ex Xue et al. 2023) TaxID=2972489 RepID=A0ABT1YFJ8_9BACL|nr:BlaI/MecI/CopY family transcriptional regulator [Paenibacillus radicis (ex Xue et al. 2023)]MCR8631972.1 BlaI/MecI/CopY family transcriptional regulator [Paenibacillus radicis (ex Xue et al. 2023)]